MAVIPAVELTNTFDTWRTRTNIGFVRLNAFAINESSLYANTLTSNVAFTAKGTATVTGLFAASGRATVGTNLTVSGNTTLGAAGKTITTTGAISHTGTQSITTNLTVSGNTNLGAAGKTASVTGLLAVTGRQTIDNNLTVSGNTTIGAAGKLANATGWFGVNGRATVSTNLFVGGNTTLNGTTTDKSNALNQTLTDAATISWDTALGRVATVTLGASRTIAAPTNQKVGTYILRVIQGGTGSYTLTWNGNFKWTAQTAPVLSTAVGAVDIFTFFSDGSKMYGSYLPDVR
jgi:hypothetical protein